MIQSNHFTECPTNCYQRRIEPIKIIHQCRMRRPFIIYIRVAINQVLVHSPWLWRNMFDVSCHCHTSMVLLPYVCTRLIALSMWHVPSDQQPTALLYWFCVLRTQITVIGAKCVGICACTRRTRLFTFRMHALSLHAWNTQITVTTHFHGNFSFLNFWLRHNAEYWMKKFDYFFRGMRNNVCKTFTQRQHARWNREEGKIKKKKDLKIIILWFIILNLDTQFIHIASKLTIYVKIASHLPWTKQFLNLIDAYCKCIECDAWVWHI